MHSIWTFRSAASILAISTLTACGGVSAGGGEGVGFVPAPPSKLLFSSLESSVTFSGPIVSESGSSLVAAKAGKAVAFGSVGRELTVDLVILAGSNRSPGVGIGDLKGSIESSSFAGSIFRSGSIAAHGGKISLHSGGHRFSFVSIKPKRREDKPETRGASLEFPNGFKLGVRSSREPGPALGTRGTGAFNIEGARSTIASLGWSGDAAGFKLSGEGMIGRTRVETRDSIMEFAAPVLSSGFRLEAERQALGGSASFGFTAPLRVERAQLRYTAGLAYDLDQLALLAETQFFNLTPDARAFNLELNWGRTFRQSRFGVGGAYGFNSGNVRGANSAAAGAWFSTRL